MSRWLIEKSGTGIEKSGTGIEKSGTGIEKSGTGIEKSGTGISKTLLACALIAVSSFAQIQASEEIDPAGVLQIVVDDNTLAVSWFIDGGVFSGVSTLEGSFSSLMLTEISVNNSWNLEVVGGGTGSKLEVVGGGTGSSAEVVGGGTGIEVVGGGTGIEVVGGGTGVEVVGGGTGTEVVGGGTGDSQESADSIYGSNVLVVGGGTGSDSISITLPAGTGLQMEVSLQCDTASVSIFDADYAEVVTFDNVPVIGATGLCSQESGGGFDRRQLQRAGKH